MELDGVLLRLVHPDKHVRCAAALEAGSRGDPRALDALAGALAAEPDFFVRETLTWALVRMGSGALPALLPLLDDPRPVVRLSAAHALSKLGDSGAGDRLLQQLGDEDADVAGKVAWALGAIGDERAIPAIVRLFARESRELHATLVSVLERYGAAALPALLDGLSHDDWQVREQSAYVLGIIGGECARDSLPRMVRDEAWQVRLAAVYALGTMGGEAGAAAVRSRLDDDDARVRQVASRQAERLARTGYRPTAGPALS